VIIKLEQISIFRDTNPDPNPPFYKADVVKATLDYITRSFSNKDKALVEILAKTTVSKF